MENEWRIDKYLAKAGAGSRKDVKKLLKKKQIMVNEEVITDGAKKIDVRTDNVTLDGERITVRLTPIYMMMNKQKNRVTATTDDHHLTVLDDVAAVHRKDLFPVGRLDKDTEGMLLLTTDGEWAHQLTAPKHNIEKEYDVLLDQLPEKQQLTLIEEGITLKDGTKTKPCRIEVSAEDQSKRRVRIVLTEGKYHQVKRMFGAIGRHVDELKRVRVSALSLDESLAPGEYRELKTEEIAKINGQLHQ